MPQYSALKIVFALAMLAFLVYFVGSYYLSRSQTIKVGVLHSLTGELAGEEIPLRDAALLAIEEINEKNLIPGIKLEPLVVDGKSDFDTFAKEAERLITKEHVPVIFGCLSSSSRKSLKPVLEKYDNLLIYPMQWEGLEISPNIIYTGIVPNQQSLPGVMWCFNNLGKKFYLVGSHLIYSRINNEIMKDHIKSLGGTILGESYVRLGETQFDNIVQDIIKKNPEVIINNLGGNINNKGFYQALHNAHVTPERIPVMTFTIAESDFPEIGIKYIEGHYATWSYMQSIHSPTNEKFVQAFKNKYGKDRVISDPMQSEYAGIYLWAASVKKHKTVNPQVIKKEILGESIDAPSGTMYIDPENRNSWDIVRVGKIDKFGQIHIIWNSSKPIEPITYPIYRSRSDWEKLLLKFYKEWGNQWGVV